MSTLNLKELLKWLHFNGHTVGFCSYTRRLKHFTCPVDRLFRDLSEINRGGGGWKQREGHNFLRLRKGRGHEKWAVKRGRVMQI